MVRSDPRFVIAASRFAPRTLVLPGTIMSPSSAATTSTVTSVAAPSTVNDADPSPGRCTRSIPVTVWPAAKSTADVPAIAIDPAPVGATAVIWTNTLVGGAVAMAGGTLPCPHTAKFKEDPAGIGPPCAALSPTRVEATGLYSE